MFLNLRSSTILAGIVARHFHQLLMKDIEATSLTIIVLDDNDDFKVCLRTPIFENCKYLLDILVVYRSLGNKLLTFGTPYEFLKI